MQRVLMLLICVCGCSFIGLRLADMLRRRACALRGMHAGIHAMTNAILHSNRTLAQIAGEVAFREEQPFWRTFSEQLAAGVDAEDAWISALKEDTARGRSLAALTQRDCALLISFAGTLGKTDRRSQAESGRMTLEALSSLIKGADAVYAQKGRVYRVLGMFLGLGVGILLW